MYARSCALAGLSVAWLSTRPYACEPGHTASVIEGTSSRNRGPTRRPTRHCAPTGRSTRETQPRSMQTYTPHGDSQELATPQVLPSSRQESPRIWQRLGSWHAILSRSPRGAPLVPDELRERVAASRARQGLPPVIEDFAVIEQAARVFELAPPGGQGAGKGAMRSSRRRTDQGPIVSADSQTAPRSTVRTP